MSSNQTILLLLALLAYGLSHPKPPELSRGLGLVAVFFCWNLLVCLISDATVDCLMESQKWWAALFFYLAGQRALAGELSVLQRLVWFHLPVWVVASHALAPLFYEDFDRIRGVFLLPGVLANWLILLLPLLMRDGLRVHSAFLLTPALTLSTLYFTMSRAGWLLAALQLGLVVVACSEISWKRLGLWLLGYGAALFGVLLGRGALGLDGMALCLCAVMILGPLVETLRGKLPGMNLLKLAGVIAVAVLLVGGLVWSRPEARGSRWTQSREGRVRSQDNSTEARVVFWKSSVNMSLDHPLTGVGPGNFEHYYPRYQKFYYYYSDSPHNAPLAFVCELGYPGALLLMILALWPLASAWRVKDKQQVPVYLALMAGLTYSLVEVSDQATTLWLALALVMLQFRAQSSPETAKTGWLMVPIMAFVLLLGLKVYPAQRILELGQALEEPKQKLEFSLESAQALPGWVEPRLQLLHDGLEVRANPAALQPWGEEVLRLAPHRPASYWLAGGVAARAGDSQRAGQLFEASLELDPFNQPQVYHQLLVLASAGLIDTTKQDAIERALAPYDLEQLDKAHPDFRETILGALEPMLLDVADALKPYRAPKRTETIYRFLLANRPSGRAYYGLGLSLWAQRRFEEARPSLEKAQRMNPKFKVPSQPFSVESE